MMLLGDEELSHAIQLFGISSGPDFSDNLTSLNAKEVYKALERCRHQMYRKGKYFGLWTDEQKESIEWENK